MPVMDGVSLVRRLHQLGVDIPSIIFVSGFSDVDEREMYHLGVEAFLAKPLRREDLLAYIEKSIADRSALWLDPLEPPPRQTIDIEAVALGCSHHLGPFGLDHLCLGRGGFRAKTTAPLSLGKVAFSCRVPGDSPGETPRVLAGQGYVRWFARAEGTAGIEFAFLDPSCRNWVVEKIASIRPHSFIPSP